MERTFTTDASIQEPVVFSSGTMSVHPHFISTSAFKALLSELSGDRGKLYDVLLYLTFVHSPSSVYKGASKAERLELMLTQQEVGDPDFVRTVERRKPVQDLVSVYLSAVSSPAARLQEALLTNIDRFIRQIAEMTVHADNAKDISELIKVGIELNEQLKTVKSMLEEERTIRMRGDYKPALFEDDRDQAARLAEKARRA